MKKQFFFLNARLSLPVLLMATTLSIQAQDDEANNKLGLPGDNFNLAAAMDVFQQSKTLEEFEEKINNDSLRLNNLDLNNDGETDYIKVFDNADGDLHNIVLQTDVNEKESQDIAVFYVEKKNDNVTVQAIGDEELYGKDYVIEPNTSAQANGTANPAYTGSDSNGGDTYVTNNYYNSQRSYSPHPSSWFIVGYLYGPAYVRWHSPWHWGYYPRWYRPWRPFYWNDYNYHWYHTHHWNGWWYHHPHHFHFHNHWKNTYYGHRKYSSTVNANRTNGTYNRRYNNPEKMVRPASKPNFPSVDARPNRKSNVTRPTNRDNSKQQKSTAKPSRQNENKAVKPRNQNGNKEQVRPVEGRKDRQNTARPNKQRNSSKQGEKKQHR